MFGINTTQQWINKEGRKGRGISVRFALTIGQGKPEAASVGRRLNPLWISLIRSYDTSPWKM